MERRLAAILAADVVGYSRLMGEDEVGTLARWTTVREEFLQPLIPPSLMFDLCDPIIGAE